jgi:probable HAF family extracellular repeat protein
VSGWASTSANLHHAFRWTEATGMVDLGTLGGSYSQGFSVSASGTTVVGTSTDGSNQWRAFRWTAGDGIQNLGTLNNAAMSLAMGASADGSVVVGYNSDFGNHNRAFRWTETGGMIDLGTLGGPYSLANGVSDDGLMTVGWSMNTAGVETAAFWVGTQNFNLQQDLAMRFPGLDQSGWEHLNTISAISGNAIDGYNLTGWGTLLDGNEQAFVITGYPIPEPGAGLMATTALTTLLLRRPRRRV